MARFGKQNRDDQLILALAGGATVRDAAAKAGVGERTAHRRLEDAAFRSRVTEARCRMFDQAIGQLAEAAATAVATLQSLLKNESATIQLRAARAILAHGQRLNESMSWELRLQALEAEKG